LLVQQNIDGSNFFNRSWAEFKVGFNDSRGNYWLGNERLHRLTNSGRHKLRFDLQARGNLSWYYAEYSTLIVLSEGSNYSVTVSGYSGNAGDAFSYNDGMMFTTFDRDNDLHRINCAANNGGGFWYKACSNANVNNALRGPRNNLRWSWFGPGIGTTTLQSTRMWVMC